MVDQSLVVGAAKEDFLCCRFLRILLVNQFSFLIRRCDFLQKLIEIGLQCGFKRHDWGEPCMVVGSLDDSSDGRESA